MADPKVVVDAAVSQRVTEVFPKGMLRLPAGLVDTPWGRPVRLTVIGALVPPIHNTVICRSMDDPVWRVAVDGLKDRMKSVPGGVELVPDSVLLPPPQPARTIANRMHCPKAIRGSNFIGNRPCTVS